MSKSNKLYKKTFSKYLLAKTAKNKEQAKTDKTKKWVPEKSRKIITERNQRK